MKATEARQSERFRIARELHDDIPQQLALVQMGLDQLKASPALTVDAAANVDALWSRPERRSAPSDRVSTSCIRPAQTARVSTI